MKLQWLHPDCLGAQWIAPAAGPSVFVFDDARIEAELWPLRRVGFLYECLLALPHVEIVRGPLIATLRSLVEAHGCESVMTERTPEPWVLQSAVELGEAGVRVDWVEPEPFVSIEGSVDLARFSRYWRKASAHLFLP